MKLWCKQCEGQGWSRQGDWPPEQVRCDDCRGAGWLSLWDMIRLCWDKWRYKRRTKPAQPDQFAD